MDPTRPALDRALDSAQTVLADLLADEPLRDAITATAAALAGSLKSGHKVLACGNGGSACDAMHFCEELTGRFRQDRPALPALALLDPAHITCVANDFGFEHVFSRMIEAHAHKGDCLIVLSTSGESPNILKAIEAARARALTVIALLGKTGGACRGLADHELIVPGQTSDRIQELHMLILHILVELIEAQLFGESA